MSAPSLAFPRWDFVEGVAQGGSMVGAMGPSRGSGWPSADDLLRVRRSPDGREARGRGHSECSARPRVADRRPARRGFRTGWPPLREPSVDHVGCVFGRRDQQTVILLFGWDADDNVPIIRFYDRCSFDKDCAEVLPGHRLAVNIVEGQPVVTVYSGWDVNLAADRTLWHNLPAGDVAAMQALTHLLWHAPKQEWWNIGWLYRSPITAFRDFYTAWSARHLARWSTVVSRPVFVRCAPELHGSGLFYVFASIAQCACGALRCATSKWRHGCQRAKFLERATFFLLLDEIFLDVCSEGIR